MRATDKQLAKIAGLSSTTASPTADGVGGSDGAGRASDGRTGAATVVTRRTSVVTGMRWGLTPTKAKMSPRAMRASDATCGVQSPSMVTSTTRDADGEGVARGGLAAGGVWLLDGRRQMSVKRDTVAPTLPCSLGVASSCP